MEKKHTISVYQIFTFLLFRKLNKTSLFKIIILFAPKICVSNIHTFCGKKFNNNFLNKIFKYSNLLLKRVNKISQIQIFINLLWRKSVFNTHFE